MKKLLAVCFFAVSSVFFTAASHAAQSEIHSKVSSFANPAAASEKSFFLVHETDRSLESSFEYKEFSEYVRKALVLKGFTETSDADNADVVIFFGYGIGDPKSAQVNYSAPLFGQTGVASAYTSGTSSGGSFGASTTFVPSYGVTGVMNRTETVTTYQRWLRLSAVEPQSLKSPATPVEMWRLEVKSEGSSGDLRYILPFMAYSSKNYLGLSSGKEVEIKIKEKNKDFLKFINENPKP